MLFNSEKIQDSFAYNKRGKLLKDRDEVIWSIFQYLDYILQFKEAIVLTILEEKQYKTPLGKHREINPHSAETERKTDFTEFRKNQRGYKGISKYYVIDVEKIAFVTGRFGEEAENDLLAVAKRLGAEGVICYQDEPLGTAHAILCGQELLEGPVVVAFADTLFRADFTIDPEADGGSFVEVCLAM